MTGIASDHLPEIRGFLQRMPEIVREFLAAMRRLAAHQPRLVPERVA